MTHYLLIGICEPSARTVERIHTSSMGREPLASELKDSEEMLVVEPLVSIGR